ncbi:MAG: hypothetical protein J6W49_07240 [Paludibacteraceae bacterium]|nr:hypothetical protein [Paludibacteraceae bacterium]MBP5743212.1 hypothetical protein [Paludibacteraceae bacterium]
MNKPRLTYLLTAISAIFALSSCEKEYTNYSVSNATLQEYVDKFLEEAEARGVKSLNPYKTGLNMYFGDCHEGAAGVTYYENPIRIVIDEETWNKYTNYADGKSQNEHTVFHELAHGLMYKKHYNDTLPNGEWATMMAGDPIPSGFIPNTNFRGERRTYYLDQLFNSSGTKTPSWAKPVFDDPTEGLTKMVDDDFSAEFDSKHWTTGENSNFKATTNTGEFVFQNKSTNNYIVPLKNITASNSGDVYVEAVLKVEMSQSNRTFILEFGEEQDNGDNTTYTYHYASFHGIRLRIGNMRCYAPYGQATSPKNIFGNDYVKVAIRKKGDYMYYFIDDKCIYKDIIDTNIGGTSYGFIVYSGSTLHVKSYRIWNDGTVSQYRSSAERMPQIIDVEERETPNK